MLIGKLTPPPSKSQSLRAILFAALGEGGSRLFNLLDSPDCEAMKKGIEVVKTGGLVDCGNSGITLRFLCAIAALNDMPVTFTGDASLQKRPIKPLLSALEQLGAKVEGMTVCGPIRGGKATVEGYDSQFVSALLIACSLADGDTELTVINPGELPWVDLTLDWLAKRGGEIERSGYTHFKIKGNRKFTSFTYTVPTDMSSLAFPVAASLIRPSKIELENLVWDPLQGDSRFFSILEKMGAKLEFPILSGPQKLKGIEVDMNDCIDAVPVLATLACFAEGPTVITGVSGARLKESNRLAAISTELNKMGGDVRETEDGLIIHPRPLHSAPVSSHHDHRIAMSLYIAGGDVSGTECIKKTYPSFIADLKRLSRFYLIGAPFSGKTAIGKRLAEVLEVPFYDTDQLLAEKHGAPVRELYKRWGEERFRHEEIGEIEETGVISFGGGTKGGRNGCVIYLKVPAETLWKRVSGTPAYLNPDNPKGSFFKLIESRQVDYEKRADFIIDLGDKNVDDAVKMLLSEFGV